MEPKLLYTAADCIETGYDCSLQGKVIDLAPENWTSYNVRK